MFRLSSLSSFAVLLLIAVVSCLVNAQYYIIHSVGKPTQWRINQMYNIPGSGYLRPVLFRGSDSDSGSSYVCGFHKSNMNFVFGVFVVQTTDFGLPPYFFGLGSPQVVWSANGNSPVNINSTLEFKPGGDLTLKDSDGTVIWSINNSGKSVVGMNLTEEGNLVLYDESYAIVWQSFDYPMDSLLLRQRLTVGQKLTPSVSSTNVAKVPPLSFSLKQEGLFGLMETEPPQIYFAHLFTQSESTSRNDTLHVQYLNGSLALFVNSELNSILFPIPSALSGQYIQFDSYGHLRVFEWSSDVSDWTNVEDLLTGNQGNCSSPFVCGAYGVCSNGQCSCPGSSDGSPHFKQIDNTNPDTGCSAITPLSCKSYQDQSFIRLKNVYYFSVLYSVADSTGVDKGSCKMACARNCSCKAAIFKSLSLASPSSHGNCYLTTQAFSFIYDDTVNGSFYTTYIKVQNISRQKKKIPSLLIIVLSVLGILFLLSAWIVYVTWRRRYDTEAEEDYLDHIPGMSSRFSYKEVKAATQNFDTKLGRGGFGSVFKGTLLDGTKVAVKKLDGVGCMQDSFIAEVKTIGSIHHVNLVRLVGFCAEKTQRLLVYEYMPNGSLEKWIFNKKAEFLLQWKQRKKIILDIAKGISYLHEECRQKILHLDIKPQNVLLDEGFNAKVSDFGLSKLIERDQSQIRTRMKGTPGYLAPEWLSAVISEKVDVYSFGVVILEVVCGRNVFDDSLIEEEKHLLCLFKRKAEKDMLQDLVDKNSEDMQMNGVEAVRTMRVAVWCLQGDYTERPSMSVVVKVLEGVMDFPENLDYNFLNPTQKVKMEVAPSDGTLLSPSILSGPR